MSSDDLPTQRGEPDDELTRRELVDGASVFGRYRLEAVAGRGGMGVVWKAYDEELRRTVALKVLPDEVAGDPEAMEELRRETRRCLELTHPNIVRVHDFVHDHRRAAIAMEFVEGETLARRRAAAPSGCLGVAELTPLVRQLCAALDYAHGKARVVHRDLKPANLLVTPDGDLKISDFGVARSLAEVHTRLTGRSPGSTSGTLPYMSPQQVAGKKPAVTDDIYSLGATLYALLTSRPPFHRGEASSLIAQIRENTPLPLAEQRAELEVAGAPVPKEWEETILACLAKEPEKRPQSAGEVARRLGIGAPAAEEPGARAAAPTPPPVAVAVAPPAASAPSTPPSGPAGAEAASAPGVRRSRGRWVWLAGAAVAAIVIVLAGYHFVTGRGRTPAAQSPHTPAETGEPGSGPQAQAPAGNLAQPQAGRAWTIPDLALALAYLRPGTFTMGSPGSEEDRYEDEGPQTRVKLTRGFWLGKTEVTQAQWEAVMGNNPSSFKGADRPVEQVSWTEAQEFCRRLTEKERAAGRLPAGFAYALPTEAQWEYACRAGNPGPYAEGGSLDDAAWYGRNSGKTTHPVAQKSVNAWGLYDMHGNVREWCRDWYGGYPGGSVTDPEGPGSGTLRVNRGGDWNNGARFCRSADRGALKPGAHFNYLGFRVALAPGPP